VLEVVEEKEGCLLGVRFDFFSSSIFPILTLKTTIFSHFYLIDGIMSENKVMKLLIEINSCFSLVNYVRSISLAKLPIIHLLHEFTLFHG
jgi:hypothetical protein